MVSKRSVWVPSCQPTGQDGFKGRPDGPHLSFLFVSVSSSVGVSLHLHPSRSSSWTLKLYDPHHSCPDLDVDLDNLFTPIITDLENSSLYAILSPIEISLAISQLGLTKAPGPDGFIGLFYKTYWTIVNQNVIDFVQVFFRNGYLLKKFNHSHIALIPKVDNPSKVNQFRPFSLANFNYKIITKILANRLKLHMDKIVSPNQSAFIKDRLIHANSILVHEIFHTIKHKQGNGGLMAIKLDMEKAFNRME